MSQSTLTAANMNLLDRWVSVFGGIALASCVFRRDSAGKTIKGLLGAEMIRRGLTGHSFGYQLLGVRGNGDPRGASVSIPYGLGVRARAAVTIARPRAEIYRFWRDFENLPRIMKHLVSVKVNSPGRSQWVAQGPAGRKLAWEAQMHNDIENELIAWRSLPGADVDSAGSVRFKDAPGSRGTEVLVHLQYNPPTGLLGATVAKLFGGDAETEIESDLFRLKQFLEAGEIATTDTQPKGPAISYRKPVQSSTQTLHAAEPQEVAS